MQLSARPIGAQRIVLVRHVTFVLILMAGILMRVQAFVYNRSFWLDEANLALNVVARSFGQLATPLDYEQGAPVGFLWLSKAVILLLGNHDYVLRLVPFLAALLSLLLMARLIQDIPPAASGYVALLLYAVGSRTAYYATEFKQYSTDTVIALLLLVLAVPCLSGEWRSRRFLAWAAVAVPALWFSHPAVFVVAGTWVALAVTRIKAGDTRRLKQLLLYALVGALSFGALYVLLLRHLAQTEKLIQYWASFFMPLSPGAGLIWLRDRMPGVLVNPVGLTLPVIGVALFVLGAVRLLAQRLAVGLALVLPLVFALGASALRVYPFADRMLLFAVPSILIVIGQGMAAVAALVRRNRYAYTAAWLVLALLLLLGPLGSAINSVRQPFGGEQVRPALEYLAAHRQPEDTVYVYYATYPTWRYYAPIMGLNVPGKIMEGRPFRREPVKYKEGIDALPREGKLWLIFSHVYTGSLGDEERLILRYVGEIGQIADVQRFSQTTLYLVSLGAGSSGAVQ